MAGQQESNFQPDAVSPVGARGIAQFMPGTAAERGLANPNDPQAAIPKAAELLANLKQRFGNLGLAAAAYNAGATRVANWLAGAGELPNETRDYVMIVTRHPVDGLERRRRGETDRRRRLSRIALRTADRRRESREALGPCRLGAVGALGKRLLERGGHVDRIRRRVERLPLVAANPAILRHVSSLAASPGYSHLRRPAFVAGSLYPQAAQAYSRRIAPKQNATGGHPSLQRRKLGSTHTYETASRGRQERIPACGTGRAPV